VAGRDETQGARDGAKPGQGKRINIGRILCSLRAFASPCDTPFQTKQGRLGHLYSPPSQACSWPPTRGGHAEAAVDPQKR
jgi:hypothetical protein